MNPNVPDVPMNSAVLVLESEGEKDGVPIQRCWIKLLE